MSYRQKTFFIANPHLFAPILNKVIPFDFSDDDKIAKYRGDHPKRRNYFATVYDHNPPTLQTDLRIDRRRSQCSTELCI